MHAASCASGPSASTIGTPAMRARWSSRSSRRRRVGAGRASYLIVERLPGREIDERADVVAGLLATPARIAPKYFYDELGCALYGAICRLPEYYPTRTEAALFREHRADIAAAMGSGRQFVDLGSGDCCKALAWLPFVNPRRYIAVDIAEAEIHRALTGMAR